MKKCCGKRILFSVICILSLPAPVVFGQDVFSTNTDDYNHSKEVDARRAKAKQQALEQQKAAEENQDKNSIQHTGQPLRRNPREYPVFASDKKKSGEYVRDNRRPGFDRTGGRPYPLGIEEKGYIPPSLPVSNYGKPVYVPEPRPAGSMTPSYGNGGSRAPRQGNTHTSGPLSGRAQSAKPIKDQVEIEARSHDGSKHNITWSYTRGQGRDDTPLHNDPGIGAFKTRAFTMLVQERNPGPDPIVSMTCSYYRGQNGSAILTTYSYTTRSGEIINAGGRPFPLAH